MAERVCKRCGVPQDISAFIQTRRNANPTTGHICKACRAKAAKAWNKKNRETIQEYKKWIPDDDPEDDLTPMEAGGFVRWAVITGERRLALGETSPFNGLSVARWRTKQ